MSPSDLIADLQRRLEANATDARRRWWMDYLRGAAVFRGVAMADVRREVHQWHGAHGLDLLDADARSALALGLIREKATEDKLAGMLLFQEMLIPEGAPAHEALLPPFADLFDGGHLADWNAVDWFCVRVLGPLVERDGEPCARAVAAWRSAPTLWQRRASAVAFVNLVGRPELFPGFRSEVLESCVVLTADPERFSQTGAGWVLREVSRADPDAVIGFLRVHGPALSTEAFRSAVKKLPADVARGLETRRRGGTRPAP